MKFRHCLFKGLFLYVGNLFEIQSSHYTLFLNRWFVVKDFF